MTQSQKKEQIEVEKEKLLKIKRQVYRIYEELEKLIDNPDDLLTKLM